MRRLPLGVAVVAAAASLAPAALATAPHLTISDTSPFTVRGAHFKPYERVRVTVTTSQGNGARMLIAGGGGGFVARYTQISLAQCSSYTVRATGSLGSRTTLRIVPECANGPTP